MAKDALKAKQIEDFKRQLESQRQTLTDQLQQLNESSKPVNLDQQSVGRVSRIDAIQQQQMATANRDQANALLQEVGLALTRIESDCFGLCLICDEPIALARLQAQPNTANCISCQSKLEQRD
ncbi:MAG: DnaK suppressor protein [Gammaproteobacteria bacterium]|jgi:DnaK suppressor protein